MKSNSTVRPQLVSRLQNSVIISFNITEVEGGYEYDQVKVSEEPTRDEVVNALIRDKYTLSQEFALINNFNSDKDLEEYEAFQVYRATCKVIADEVIQNLH